MSEGGYTVFDYSPESLIPLWEWYEKRIRIIDKTSEELAYLTKNRGWKVGDPIDNFTKAGNEPSWSTVRSRCRKNEVLYNSSKYSDVNLTRMRKGRALKDL